MEKNKMNILIEEASEPKVYSKDSLIYEVGSIFNEIDTSVKFNALTAESFYQFSEIYKNTGKKFLLDFLGKDYEKQVKTVPYFNDNGVFEKDRKIIDLFNSKRNLITKSLFLRPLLGKYLDQPNEIISKNKFKDIFILKKYSMMKKRSAHRDFISLEFLSKDLYDNTSDSEDFIYVRSISSCFSSSKGSMDFYNPEISENIKARVEYDINYSKIKYIEKHDAIFVENRTACLIKKRNLLNLTVRKEYYDNLLFSILHPNFNRNNNNNYIEPIKNTYDIMGIADEGTPLLNFIKSNPNSLSLVKDFDEDEYIVFDILDYSYNVNNSSSNAYLIERESTTKISRTINGKVKRLSSLSKSVKASSSLAKMSTKAIPLSLCEASRGSAVRHDKSFPKSYGVYYTYNYNLRSVKASSSLAKMSTKAIPLSLCEASRGSAVRHDKSFPKSYGVYYTYNYNLRSEEKWIKSDERINLFVAIFSSFGRNGEIVDIQSNISNLPFIGTIKNIFKLSLDKDIRNNTRIKNASILSDSETDDKVNTLFDLISKDSANVLKDFKKNGGKVSMTKIKEAFDKIPKHLKKDRSDWIKGEAIKIDDNRYIKLSRYIHRFNKEMFVDYENRILLHESTCLSSIELAIRVTIGNLILFAHEIDSGNSIDGSNRTATIESFVKTFSPSESHIYGLYPYQDNPIIISRGNNSIFRSRHDYLKEVVDGHPYQNKKSLQTKISKDMTSFHRNNTFYPSTIISTDPLLEPTQYKVIAKDSEGNLLLSMVRPFIGVDSDENGRLCLESFIPNESLGFFFPKDDNKENMSARFVTYDNELQILGKNSYTAIAPVNKDVHSELVGSPLSMVDGGQTVSIYDALHGNLGPIRENKDTNETLDVFGISKAWINVNLLNKFSASFNGNFKALSSFFDKYRIPTSRLLTNNETLISEKGDDIKKYFKDTAFERLRIDAWLGKRPADKRNLYLYDARHWVSNRRLFDEEFWRYVSAVITAGAYHLPSIIELGLDLRNIEYEDFNNESITSVSFYSKSIMGSREDARANHPLSFNAGIISKKMNKVSKANKKINSLSLWEQRENIRCNLLKLKNGEFKSYIEFLANINYPYASDEKIIKERERKIKNLFNSSEFNKIFSIGLAHQIIARIDDYNDGDEKMFISLLSSYDYHIIDRVRDTLDNDVVLSYDRLSNLVKDMIELNSKMTMSDITSYCISLKNEQMISNNLSYVISDYHDYITSLKTLSAFVNIDWNNRKIVFPQSLLSQKRIVDEQIRIAKDEKQKALFLNVRKKYSKMEFKDKDYIIRMAESPAELTTEGLRLGHCVGSYTNNVISGESVIFFLRNRKRPNEPLITVEFRPGQLNNLKREPNLVGKNKIVVSITGTIEQVQGISRRAVNKDEALFLNKWRLYMQDVKRKETKIMNTFDGKMKIIYKADFRFSSQIQGMINKTL